MSRTDVQQSTRRERARTAAENRVHERLMRDPSAQETPPATFALISLSGVVIAVALAGLGGLVWATFVVSKGPWGWVGVVVGWLVVWEITPRPHRLEGARDLSGDEFPALKQLIGDVASAVGVAAPKAVAVDTSFDARVAAVGWTGRQTLVIGLPLWTCLRDDERIVLLGHELGHLRGGETAAGLLVGTARTLVERITLLVRPLHADAISDFEEYRVGAEGSNGLVNRLGRAILWVLALPLTLLSIAFERLDREDRHRREFVADLRAAQIAGGDAFLRLMLTAINLPGLHTLAGAAFRRGEDPFVALDVVPLRPRPTSTLIADARRRARETERRADPSYPRDDLRTSLVEAAMSTGAPMTPSLGGPFDVRAADGELRSVRAQLTKQFGHDLQEVWC